MVVLWQFIVIGAISTAFRGDLTTSAHRIAFGSCFDPNKGGKIWQLINRFEPNHLILLGDQIYADKPTGYWDDRTPDVIKREYDVFRENKYWQALRKSLDYWSVVFDDHDFGVNNADKTFPHRNISQKLFREFAASALEQSDSGWNSGVYSSTKVSVPTKSLLNSSISDDNRAGNDEFTEVFTYKVILLDSRSNKDPKGTNNGDFLGEEQWQWLAAELSDPEPDLVLLGSSIQMLPEDKLVEESWQEFPQARERLLALVTAASYSKNIVLLSGDIHRGEVMRARCTLHSSSPLSDTPSEDPSASEEGQYREVGVNENSLSVSADLWELTSSGLGHTFTESVHAEAENAGDHNLDSVDSIGSACGSADNTGEGSGSCAIRDEPVPVSTRSRGYFNQLVDWVYQTAYPGYYRQRGLKDTYTGVHFATIDIVNAEAAAAAAAADEGMGGERSNSLDESEARFFLRVQFVNATGHTVLQHERIPLPDRRTRIDTRAGVGAAVTRSNCSLCKAVFDRYSGYDPTSPKIPKSPNSPVPADTDTRAELGGGCIDSEESACEELDPTQCTRSSSEHSDVIKISSSSSSGDSSGGDVVLECVPYWGLVPLWRRLLYRGSIALALLCLVVLPLLALLWLVLASVWYICIGSEMRRRRKIEDRYQAAQRSKQL